MLASVLGEPCGAIWKPRAAVAYDSGSGPRPWSISSALDDESFGICCLPVSLSCRIQSCRPLPSIAPMPRRVDAPSVDLRADAVEMGPAGDGMDADGIVPDARADGRVERAAADHVLLVGAVGQDDVVQRQPADGHEVGHASAPNSRVRRSR